MSSINNSIIQLNGDFGHGFHFDSFWRKSISNNVSQKCVGFYIEKYDETQLIESCYTKEHIIEYKIYIYYGKSSHKYNL